LILHMLLAGGLIHRQEVRNLPSVSLSHQLSWAHITDAPFRYYVLCALSHQASPQYPSFDTISVGFMNALHTYFGSMLWLAP